jgi:23S rRNA (cytidine1920-2'-O)/16S rRNA (cytidine1409-2'-O)-methyltransferase
MPAKSVRRMRLDTLLVERGLAPSRERARALILAGHVSVQGMRESKAGTLVSVDSDITLDAPDHPYVSRGGLKLVHALDVFGLDVTGRAALDIGASTGGFTDVLLQRGARPVVALDVGHGQLDWRLRGDSRVIVIERANARTLTPDSFGDGPRRFGIVTIDVSFISLRLVLAPVPALLESAGDVVALVKPQFEAGRQEVGKGGIVRDPEVHQRVLGEVIAAAAELGLSTMGTTASPIEGMEGNREFLIHLRAARGRAASTL